MRNYFLPISLKGEDLTETHVLVHKWLTWDREAHIYTRARVTPRYSAPHLRHSTAARIFLPLYLFYRFESQILLLSNVPRMNTLKRSPSNVLFTANILLFYQTRQNSQFSSIFFWNFIIKLGRKWKSQRSVRPKKRLRSLSTVFIQIEW